VRVWRAKIVPARMEEFQRFEQERCLPMLRKQPGFLGVLLCPSVSLTSTGTPSQLARLRR
jgi:hypothetical protein